MFKVVGLALYTYSFSDLITTERPRLALHAHSCIRLGAVDINKNNEYFWLRYNSSMSAEFQSLWSPGNTYLVSVLSELMSSLINMFSVNLSFCCMESTKFSNIFNRSLENEIGKSCVYM